MSVNFENYYLEYRIGFITRASRAVRILVNLNTSTSCTILTIFVNRNRFVPAETHENLIQDSSQVVHDGKKQQQKKNSLA